MCFRETDITTGISIYVTQARYVKLECTWNFLRVCQNCVDVVIRAHLLEVVQLSLVFCFGLILQLIGCIVHKNASIGYAHDVRMMSKLKAIQGRLGM